MGAPKEKTPKWISRQQLAKWGVVLVRRDPLIIQCPTCGVEWQPMRLPGVRWWRCHNGCNDFATNERAAGADRE